MESAVVWNFNSPKNGNAYYFMASGDKQRNV